MQENFIISPTCYSLTISEWHFLACDNNDCASALLAFLITFHNDKQNLKEYIEFTNKMLREQGKESIPDEVDWQYHTDEILCNRLLFWKKETILKAIKFLREKNFVDTKAPEYLRKMYNTGRTKWFLVRADAINGWIIKNFQSRSEEELAVKPLAPLERKKHKPVKHSEGVKRLFHLWQLVTGHMKALANETRMKMISARLEDGKTEDELAQSILGNSVSDWHQGRNPHSRNGTPRLFNQIKHIFKDAEQVEYFQGIAEDNGITLIKTRETLNKLLSESNPLKTSAKAQSSGLNGNPVDEAYFRSAKLIKKLVVDEKKKLRQVIEIFFNKQDELNLFFDDLSDSVKLSNEIIQIISVDDMVSPARKQRISNFADKFIKALRGDIDIFSANL